MARKRKLTDEQISEIKSRVAKGEKVHKMGKDYGVSDMTVAYTLKNLAKKKKRFSFGPKIIRRPAKTNLLKEIDGVMASAMSDELKLKVIKTVVAENIGL